MVIPALLAGCATTLTDAGQKVKIATASQMGHCETLKMVSFNQRLGPDKPGNAMQAVLNETAEAGGNASLSSQLPLIGRRVPL